MPSVVEACGAAIKKSPPSAQPKYLQHRDTGVSKKTFQAWSMYTHTHMALEHAQIAMLIPEFQRFTECSPATEGTLR